MDLALPLGSKEHRLCDPVLGASPRVETLRFCKDEWLCPGVEHPVEPDERSAADGIDNTFREFHRSSPLGMYGIGCQTMHDETQVFSRESKIASICGLLRKPAREDIASVTTREKNMFKRGKNLDRHPTVGAILPHQPHIRVTGKGIHPWFFLYNSWLDESSQL
jgi:hypothetical protein